MIRLNNDYCHGAIPEILEALQTTNSEAYAGYELDEWCERAGALIKEAAACPDAAVHYIVGGTQANVAFIAHALRPWESVVCADCGHINVHETGATEHIGHKCETVPARDGKLAASDLRAVAQGYAESPVSEHVTVPRMAYISFPSESGTVYSLAELEALRAVCDEFGMYLFVDGARLAYGLAASGNDVALPDIARLSDAFYIGGTKCGALFGEAMVVVNPALQPYFRNSMKQAGTMLAKGWLLGLQFTKLFEAAVILKSAKSQWPKLCASRRRSPSAVCWPSPTAPRISSSPLFPMPSSHRLARRALLNSKVKGPTAATWFASARVGARPMLKSMP